MRPLMYFFVRPPVLAHTILHIFMSLVCISRTAGKPHHARKKSRSRILSQTALFPFAARLRAYDMYIGVYTINTHTLCGRTICWGIGQSCIKLPVYIYRISQFRVYVCGAQARCVDVCADFSMWCAHTARHSFLRTATHTCAEHQRACADDMGDWRRPASQPARNPHQPHSHTPATAVCPIARASFATLVGLNFARSLVVTYHVFVEPYIYTYIFKCVFVAVMSGVLLGGGD